MRSRVFLAAMLAAIGCVAAPPPCVAAVACGEFTRCTAMSATGATGIDAGNGQGNAINKSATLSGDYGIYETGDQTSISKSRIFGSSQIGFYLFGANNNEISKNIVIGNALSDFDEFPSGCGNGNVWSDNIGIEGQACLQ